MSGPAQVRSSEAVERLGQALASFRHRSIDALETLERELRRLAEWLEHERPTHWKVQLRQAEDDVHQAKMDLQRCLTFPTVEGQRPACREEKDELARAKARVDFCREKSERVRHWQRAMHREMFEYHARVGQLRQLLEMDVPRGEETLRRIVRRVDEYAAAQKLTRLDAKPQAGSSDATD